MLIDLASQQSI